MANKTNRRTLIAGMMAGVASAPFASVHAAEWRKSDRWDVQTDVIVVGFGGAGATAAIAAHDSGSKVIVFEKMAQGGGNTAASGGGFIIPADEEKAYEYLSAIYDFANNDWDPSLLKAFCRESAKLRDFFERLSPDIRLGVYGHGTFPKLPHADTITKHSVKGRRAGGVCLFEALSQAVAKRGIDVRLSTPVKRLIRRGGEVVGVEAVANGKSIRVCARKGVILATGGFECDKESLQNYALGTEIYSLGSPGNTGDGLRMAMSMGAKLWHMTSYACPLGIRVPGYDSCVGLGIKGKSFIWVNRYGQRFVNEAGVDIHNCLYSVNRLDTLNHGYPAIPCYMVFDEAFRKSGPVTNFMFGYAVQQQGYQWSRDNTKEIASGVIKKADTLEKLAEMIHVAPEALRATVDEWNRDIAKGDDPKFGRKQHQVIKGGNPQFAPSLSAPLASEGPYYAVELVPALLHSNGGPKRNAEGNIIDAENVPIPRLYGAGELGSIWGTFQQGSTNLAECLAYGIIAGRSVSALKPWSQA